jgi:hypothetical protein
MVEPAPTPPPKHIPLPIPTPQETSRRQEGESRYQQESIVQPSTATAWVDSQSRHESLASLPQPHPHRGPTYHLVQRDNNSPELQPIVQLSDLPTRQARLSGIDGEHREMVNRPVTCQPSSEQSPVPTTEPRTPLAHMLFQHFVNKPTLTRTWEKKSVAGELKSAPVRGGGVMEEMQELHRLV